MVDLTGLRCNGRMPRILEHTSQLVHFSVEFIVQLFYSHASELMILSVITLVSTQILPWYYHGNVCFRQQPIRRLRGIGGETVVLKPIERFQQPLANRCIH